MVAKDLAGSKQAQVEQSILEKKTLYALAAAKNKNVKIPSPQTLMKEVAKDFKYETHQLHCLKALLEKDLSYHGCSKPACLANGCHCKKVGPKPSQVHAYVHNVFGAYINDLDSKQNPVTHDSADSDDSDDGDVSDEQEPIYYQHNGIF